MNCKIYMIYSNNLPYVYIGQTLLKLQATLNNCVREYDYFIDYNNWENNSLESKCYGFN